MKVCIYVSPGFSEIRKYVTKILNEYKIEYKLCEERIESQCEFVFVIGKDGDVLRLFLHNPNLNKPVLGVNISDTASFLTEIKISDLSSAVYKIINNEYSVERHVRIMAITDDYTAYALNEIAIFPNRSATLMEYELWIDGELVWRDYSDGVLIATPLGSTAYAMSAGGVFIHSNACVLEIVSVNSIDPSRRPIIVSCDSEIKLSNISSRYKPVLIIDGATRKAVEGDIKIIKAKSPALFVKINKEESILDKIKRKIEQSKDILDLPPSAKFVLKILEYEGELTQRDIVEKTLLPPRTVRYALSILLKKGLISERYDLSRDARKKIYFIPQRRQ